MRRMETLARELVSFDARISEDVAEHLAARAEGFDGRDDERAERFRALAKLIQRELGLEPLPAGFGPSLAQVVQTLG
jgi:hypothetical protein